MGGENAFAAVEDVRPVPIELSEGAGQLLVLAVQSSRPVPLQVRGGIARVDDDRVLRHVAHEQVRSDELRHVQASQLENLPVVDRTLQDGPIDLPFLRIDDLGTGGGHGSLGDDRAVLPYAR